MVAEKLHAGSRGLTAENFVLVGKIRVLAQNLQFTDFQLRLYQKSKPLGGAPKFIW